VNRPVSVRRRLAVATWRPSRDGRIYTRICVDVTPVRAYIADVRARVGERVTLTHVVGAALGRCVAAVPEIRARVVLGRIIAHPTCDIGFAVDVAGDDLAPVQVRSVERLTPLEVARQVTHGAARLRAGDDHRHNRSSSIVRRTPAWLMRPMLAATGLLVGGLGVAALGQPGFPLGSAFVSNVGTLGLDEAFLAPLPFARVPLYLAIGAVRETPAVVDGTVVAQPQVVLVATADHRLVDGSHAGRVTTLLRRLLAEPSLLDVPWSASPLSMRGAL
jgi:pyruvate dehydrogenase E2 component (dihydrolipoamide acetyltransferase)